MAEPTNEPTPQVTNGAETAPDRPEGSYHVHEDADGRVNAVTFYRAGKQPRTRFRRDNESDDDTNWFELIQELQPALKRQRELQGAINNVQAAIGDHVEHCVDPIDPPPIEWPRTALPEHARARIDGKYFLVVEQGTCDVHGNKYAPNADSQNRPILAGHKPGSLCAGSFPHAVIQSKKCLKVKDYEPTFLVGACHVVEFSIRLYKRVDGLAVPVPCSEKEVLDVIGGAVTNHAGWGDLEKRMFLHLSLQWGDTENSGDADDPVHQSAFVVPPRPGLLDPPEGHKPGMLRNAPAGYYEFEMIDGAASIKFRINAATSTPNLADEHKLRPFTFAIRAMNPFLAGMDGMFIRTVSFQTKRRVARYASGGTRFVEKNGQLTPSPAHDARMPTPYAWWR